MSMDSAVARDANRSPRPAGEGQGARENAAPAGICPPIIPTLGAAELLALWETGAPRHSLDRALLLGALARPDLPPADLADLPLGALNAALLRLRAHLFGSRLDAWLDCARCGERLELSLDTDTLLGAADGSDARAELELAGHRFRAPSTRDLAAVARERDAEAAARRLLDLCCMTRPEDATIALEALLDAAGAGLEALDPTAEFSLDVACEACGHVWSAPLDIGALLWEEVSARARGLLGEVHLLARAYGWREADILALGEHRRAAYLDRVAVEGRAIR
jgi:hypothetical protein